MFISDVHMIAYNYLTLRPRGSGDRASASGAEGRRFESYRGRHLIASFCRVGCRLILKPSRPYFYSLALAGIRISQFAICGVYVSADRSPECLGIVVLRRRAASPSSLSCCPLSLHWRPPLRASLIQIGMNCFSPCIGAPLVGKEGANSGKSTIIGGRRFGGEACLSRAIL